MTMHAVIEVQIDNRCCTGGVVIHLRREEGYMLSPMTFSRAVERLVGYV